MLTSPHEQACLMVGHIYGPKMQIDEGEIRCNIGNMVVSWDVRCCCGSTCMQLHGFDLTCRANAVTGPFYLGWSPHDDSWARG